MKTNLSKRIIDHLKINKNGKDDLDNIIISIYDNEMQDLSQKIVQSLSELIKEGIISEDKNNDDTILYKINSRKQIRTKD